MASCKNCGAELPAGAKFCFECGSPVPQVKSCPQCGGECPSEAKFCMNCGYSFMNGKSTGGIISGDANAVSAHDIVNGNQEIVHGNKEVIGGDKIVAQNYTINNNVQEEVFGASDVNVKKLLKEAIEYYEDEDYFSALKLFRQIADKDIKAQYYIGLCYSDGDGVMEDEEEAAKWFNKAASHGYPDAQYELAWIHLSEGKFFNKEKGIRLLNMSASQGFKDAMYDLAAFYLLGEFVEKDYERAYYFYSKLDPEDYPAALYGCAVACFDKNPEEACKLLKKATKDNYTPTMNEYSWAVAGQGCLLWSKILCNNINGYGQYDKGIEELDYVIKNFKNVAEEAQKFLEQIEKNEEGNIFRNYGDYQSDGKGNYIVNDGVCSLIKTEYGRKKSIIPDDAVSVVLPTSLKKIEESAFSCYKYLERVTIPDSVTVIEDSAFSCCNSLKKIELPNSITIIDEHAFFSTGLEEITIPDSVTSIGTSAFSSCERLKSVTLSNNLNYLGRDSFRECKKLTKVVIPNTLVKIEVQTFLECTMLSEVTLPETIQTIEDSAFYGCRSLHRINMPQNLREIGDDAFCGCRSLTSISIPRGVKSIGEDAFEDCTKITYLSETESNKKAGELTDKNEKKSKTSPMNQMLAGSIKELSSKEERKRQLEEESRELKEQKEREAEERKRKEAEAKRKREEEERRKAAEEAKAKADRRSKLSPEIRKELENAESLLAEEKKKSEKSPVCTAVDVSTDGHKKIFVDVTLNHSNYYNLEFKVSEDQTLIGPDRLLPNKYRFVLDEYKIDGTSAVGEDSKHTFFIQHDLDMLGDYKRCPLAKIDVTLNCKFNFFSKNVIIIKSFSWSAI